MIMKGNRLIYSPNYSRDQACPRSHVHVYVYVHATYCVHVCKSFLETYHSHASEGAMSVYDDPDCNGECCSGQTSAPFQPDIDYSTVKKTQGKQSRVFQKK